MYHAKNCGKNNAKLYSSSLTMQIMSHVKLEVGLRKALQNDELYLLYQPQIDVHSSRIVGFEALVRWRHPERGVISPTEFIPGRRNRPDRADRRMGAAHRLPAGDAWQLPGKPPVRVAVNLSAKQFKDENLTQSVLSALHDSGLPAELLELELTEGTLMDDARHHGHAGTAARHRRVFVDRRFRHRLLVDELSEALRRARAEDRQELHQRPAAGFENAAITRAIIAMAHGLKMAVVAEGVETDAQLVLLEQYGCDMVQGYYLGHPPRPTPSTACWPIKPYSTRPASSRRWRRCCSRGLQDFVVVLAQVGPSHLVWPGVADSFGEMAGSLTGVPSANWCCSNISRARNCGSPSCRAPSRFCRPGRRPLSALPARCRWSACRTRPGLRRRSFACA
jgi:EAL domain-containing protein (putative c-di-GMP-specific phosphodiesterase class I)